MVSPVRPYHSADGQASGIRGTLTRPSATLSRWARDAAEPVAAGLKHLPGDGRPAPGGASLERMRAGPEPGAFDRGRP